MERKTPNCLKRVHQTERESVHAEEAQLVRVGVKYALDLV